MLKSRVVDGRGHFKNLLISLIKRALYKYIEKYSKFKAKMYDFFLNYNL